MLLTSLLFWGCPLHECCNSSGYQFSNIQMRSKKPKNSCFDKPISWAHSWNIMKLNKKLWWTLKNEIYTVELRRQQIYSACNFLIRPKNEAEINMVNRTACQRDQQKWKSYLLKVSYKQKEWTQNRPLTSVYLPEVLGKFYSRDWRPIIWTRM